MIKSYLIFCIWSIYLVPSILVSQVTINEFLASNVSSYMEEDFYNFSDWLEIKNNELATIDIGGCFLTDDFNDFMKWQIPDNTFIGPGESMIFIADEMDIGANSTYYFMTISNYILDSIIVQYNHLNFSLSTKKDEIALINPSGIIIDSISYGEQLADISYGRSTSSPFQWVYFSNPTPGLPNTSPSYNYKIRAEAPIFSIPAGLYPGTQSVSLTTSSPTAEIHFSIDGSIPDIFSPLYTEAIEISSTTVVRTRVFDTLFLPGPVITNTYLIDEDSDLTIISVALNSEFLWDDTIGIYVAGNNGIPGMGSSTPKNWNQDWERPINIELFSPDNNPEFNEQTGVKIYGYASRKGDQKSFSFYMKNKYGTDHLDYQLFKEKSSKHYKRFILRNRGQRTAAYLKLNDVMMQSIIADEVNVDDQAYEPVVLFLNGEYWGIYSMREKLDKYYAESNFGMNPEKIDFIEHALAYANSGDTIHYRNMLHFMDQNDMSLDENYAYIKTQMDIDEYINYQITEIYASNVDWPANNIKYWRPKTINGIWRWILYDMDNAFEYVTRNSLAYATAPNGPSWPNPPYSTFLFRKLLENNEFKYQFIQQFASHLNITFDPQRVIDITSSINQEIESEKAKHTERWGTSQTMNASSFASLRPQYMRSYIIAEFDLASFSNLTVNFSQDEGLIFVSNVQIPDSGFIGKHFEDIPIQIKAIAKPGYQFVEWEGISDNYTTSIIINGDSTISAIFEKSTSINNIYINEFMADNEGTIKDPQGDYDDWIEIYNGGSGIVDIGGLFITDNHTEPNQYMIPTSQPDSTSIFPGDYLVLWADKDLADGVLHLNIKLSKDGEEIGLFSLPDNNVIDSLTFGEQSSDVSFGRYPDGNQLLVNMPNSTANQSNIYYLNLAIDIFLEGAFSESEMHTELNAAGVIPFSQPFDIEPWNYSGQEYVSTPPIDAVDWVLIELRDTTDASIATNESIISRQAVFVLKDGTIVDIEGSSMLKFHEPVKHNLFVVAHHRNHLAVMSAQSLVEIDGIYSYNFTSGENTVYGGIAGHKQIANDIWGMIGGDSNADGIINQGDKILWKSEAGTKGYKVSDMNLNHEIDNKDKNYIWYFNHNATSAVPQ